MRIMPDTGVGKAGVDGFAAYSGIQPADFIAGMTGHANAGRCRKGSCRARNRKSRSVPSQ